MLRDLRTAAGAVDRSPLTGVFLTHAHIGHYLGLAFFGFEAISTKDLPVYCTPRMAAFLKPARMNPVKDTPHVRGAD